jgi:hypothetical protein
MQPDPPVAKMIEAQHERPCRAPFEVCEKIMTREVFEPDMGIVRGCADVEILRAEQPVHRKMKLQTPSGAILHVDENITWTTKTVPDLGGHPRKQMVVDFRLVPEHPFFSGHVLGVVTETGGPNGCTMRAEMHWTVKEGTPTELASVDMSVAMKGYVEALARICEEEWEKEKGVRDLDTDGGTTT